MFFSLWNMSADSVVLVHRDIWALIIINKICLLLQYPWFKLGTRTPGRDHDNIECWCSLLVSLHVVHCTRASRVFGHPTRVHVTCPVPNTACEVSVESRVWKMIYDGPAHWSNVSLSKYWHSAGDHSHLWHQSFVILKCFSQLDVRDGRIWDKKMFA